MRAMIGNQAGPAGVAGALSALIVGCILTWTDQNWTLTFYVSCGSYLVGGPGWLLLDSHTPLEEA